MKIILVAVCVILSTGKPVFERQNDTPKHQTVSQKKPQKTPSPSPYQKSETATTTNQYTTANNSDDSAEWWLVGVGIGGVVIGLATLGFLFMQARATQAAAKATSGMVQAMIRTERAHLIIEINPLRPFVLDSNGFPLPIDGGQFSDDSVTEGKYLQHVIKIINIGKTPGRLMDYMIECLCLNEGEKRISRNLSRSYKETGRIPLDVWVKGNCSIDLRGEIIDVQSQIGDSYSAVFDGKQTAIFRGLVRYAHIFSETEVLEAHFLYHLSPSTRYLVKTREEPQNEDDKDQA
jgi:hypothetical protein